MKKLNLLFTALLLMCYVGTAKAVEVTIDGINYDVITDTKQATVISGGDYSGDIVIPSEITYDNVAYSVTSIGNGAFIGCYVLTSITIPNSVTSIGDVAFGGCYRLTSITIPNSVTSIGFSVFSGCSGLESIVVDPGNTKYDSRENCNAIIETESNKLIAGCKNTVIPNSVTSIGEEAFYQCSRLTSITIPNSVTSIEYRAFYGCSGLTSITIPNSVTSIGNEAFSYCHGLTSITIPNSVTSIGERAFSWCEGLTSITIPNSVTSIGEEAFYYCEGLTSVTIGNSVTSIGWNAFDGCSGLKEVHINDLVAWCNIDFGGSDANPLYYAQNLYLNNELITELVIPNSVTSIGERAFEGCSGLTSVTIPNSVTSIGNSAFSNCSGLTSITIPNSVTSIGNYAFEDCFGLKTVYNFSNLTFSKGSWNYGDIARYADKVYNANNGSIEGDYIFGKPNDISTLILYLGNETELTLPADYKGESYVIDESAFEGNNTIASITIPNSVTSIGNQAFYGCEGLTSITIPNSVTSIGSYAFAYCSGLTSITIPNSVASIGSYAFAYCSGLTSITIPNSVTSIGYGAFSGCENIETLYISNAIESIGENAFAGCKKIKEIKIGLEKPIRCNANIFADAVYDNATLYIPNGTKSLYDKREPWNLFFDIAETDFTGIDDIEAENGNVKTIYDLQGRRIENPTNGIYIINGKKTFLK